MIQQDEAELYEWRQKALGAITTVGFCIAVPLLIYAFLTPHIKPSLPMIISFSSACLCLCIPAVFRKLPLEIRGIFWIISGYLGGIVAFCRVGMAGSGRIFMLGMPILALTLIGKRVGFICAAVSILITLFFAALCPSGQMEKLLVVHHNPTELGFWLIQVVSWLLFLLPMMITGEKFQELQQKTLKSTLEANKQLLRETKRRKSANELLKAEIEVRKKLEMDVLEISERERRHIGYDLHDGICQMLTGTLIRCRVYENNLLESKENKEHFQTIQEMISESLDLSYDLSRGLVSSGNVHQLGLLEHIKEYVRKIPERYELDCRLNIDGPLPTLGEQQNTQLLRIVQEATHNAVKHAHADKITIHIMWSSPYIELEVRDNGRGIPKEVNKGNTMGLRIMSYRAGIIGGELSIDSSEESGTRIHCRVPLSSESSLFQVSAEEVEGVMV